MKEKSPINKKMDEINNNFYKLEGAYPALSPENGVGK